MDTAEARRAPFPIRANHKRCGKCGRLVSRAAYECRRCGKRQRIRPRSMLLLAAGCLMAGMFAFAGMSAVFPAGARVADAADGVPAAPPTAPVPPAPAIVGDATAVSAIDLWAAYAQDPAAADRRFKGRALAVTGAVRSVERDFEGSPVVRLSTGDAFDTVNAKLATRNESAIEGVSKGRAITVLCVGRSALMGAPLLGDCSVK